MEIFLSRFMNVRHQMRALTVDPRLVRKRLLKKMSHVGSALKTGHFGKNCNEEEDKGENYPIPARLPRRSLEEILLHSIHQNIMPITSDGKLGICFWMNAQIFWRFIPVCDR